MFMSKRALYGLKYFFECEIAAFNVKPYSLIHTAEPRMSLG